MDSQPPFQDSYKILFGDLENLDNNPQTVILHDYLAADDHQHDQLQLPTIDLNRLSVWLSGRKECVREIGKAAKEWGFFQVVNHGISRHLLERVRQEQEKLFREPFNKKANIIDDNGLLNLSKGCYRWGSPTATSLMQFSWSEAFHIPLSHISRLRDFNSPSSAIEEFAEMVSELAQTIGAILAENLVENSSFFVENCFPSSCYLRLNRYPPCPFFPQVHGLVPHTDSDFLTILYQDSVGGLQLIKDGEWIGVKPNPDALIINVGDLFQAWSNGVYKSIQHRVLTNCEKERFSIAYFMCPSYDTVIQSCTSEEYPSAYRRFTFREYRERVQEDVKSTGFKTGLPRFLA